jgi:hypothetical protein
MRFLITFFLFLWTFVPTRAQLPQAHAHNDYEHEKPLADALRYGFTSIEVDVHLVDGELYVSHDPPQRKRRRRTLRRLYLDPLQRRIEKNGGEVYPGYGGAFYLMIDIKTDAEATYQELRRQLEAYQPMLTTYAEDQKKPGAVTVFLSGNRPIETVKKERQRLVALDGRPSDLGKGYSPDLMPVVSDNYRNHLRWRGEGPIPAEEKAYLKSLCEKVRSEGKLLRLWASPEKEVVWKLLLESGAGFISTDELERFYKFKN